MLKYCFDIIFFMMKNLHLRQRRYPSDGIKRLISTMISLRPCGISLSIS